MFKINLLKKSNEFSEVWRKKYNLFNFFLHTSENSLDLFNRFNFKHLLIFKYNFFKYICLFNAIN